MKKEFKLKLIINISNFLMRSSIPHITDDVEDGKHKEILINKKNHHIHHEIIRYIVNTTTFRYMRVNDDGIVVFGFDITEYIDPFSNP
jgi:hypothetical protein